MTGQTAAEQVKWGRSGPALREQPGPGPNLQRRPAMVDATQRPLVARPTLYRGIQMRSRLEADFARWLDSPRGKQGYPAWEYEPMCFASPDGQYLPDFRLDTGRGVKLYAEIKPAGFPGDAIDAVLTKMQIIWASEPEAALALIFWPYGGDSWNDWLFTMGSTRIWIFGAHKTLMSWPGMGQVGLWLEDLRNPPTGAP